MSTIIPIPISSLAKESEVTSRTYRLDFERGRIVGMVDELEAVTQFIHKTLITPRFKCLIYDNQYGSEIKNNIISADVDEGYTSAELPRLVEDALLGDGRVLQVYDFELVHEKDTVTVRFKADTIYGIAAVEEAF